MPNSSIWPTDRTLSGDTTPGQSGPGSDGNKEVLHIPQSFSISGASPSNCLVSYSGHFLGESYPSAGMLSVYSAAPADWARVNIYNWSKIQIFIIEWSTRGKGFDF